MKYQLFLTDFDGTLVKGDGTVSQKNLDAIREYQRRGGMFCVVTGRMLSSILPRLREMGLFGLVAAYQGGTIADVQTGKLLKNEGFEQFDALEVTKFLESADLHLHVYLDDVLYCNRDDALLLSYEKTCGVKGVVLKEPLSKLLEERGGVVSKILCMVEPERQEALVRDITAHFGGKFFVTSSSQWLVEVMPQTTSKAYAVKFLSEYFHIPKEKTATIGDHYNDLPMLEEAGGRYAVENAEAPLKAIAKVVAPCERDGVSEALFDAMGDA